MRLKLLSILCLLTFGTFAEACFMSYKPETYARQCPIIVVGEITEIKDPKLDKPYYFDNVQIKVEKVLKDVLKDVEVKPGKSLTVKMPSASNKTMISTDLRYPVGKRGVWLIVLTKDGSLHIDRNPVQLQPIDDEAKIRKAGNFKTETRLTKEGETTEIYTKKEWLDLLGKQYVSLNLDPMYLLEEKKAPSNEFIGEWRIDVQETLKLIESSPEIKKQPADSVGLQKRLERYSKRMSLVISEDKLEIKIGKRSKNFPYVITSEKHKQVKLKATWKSKEFNINLNEVNSKYLRFFSFGTDGSADLNYYVWEKIPETK